jgi:hypothetical protein
MMAWSLNKAALQMFGFEFKKKSKEPTSDI